MVSTCLVRALSLFGVALVCVVHNVAGQTLELEPPLDQREQVTIPNPAVGSVLGFGASLAIEGDTLVVGAPYFAAAGSTNGAALTFIRSGSTWVHQQTLPGGSGLGFGGTVAVSGDSMIVGSLRYSAALGGARVYVRSGGAWTLQATLVPDDSVSTPDRLRDVLVSVAIDGNTALVANGAGAAYVFTRTGTTWTQQAKLTGENVDTGFSDRSVALEANTAVIGAPYAAVGPNAKQGAALVFVRNGATWTQQAALTSSASRAGSRFATTVAFSGDTALFLDGGSSITRAYRFTRAGGTWTEQAPLVPPSRSIFPPSLRSVALDGDTAILGERGSAHIFRQVGVQWTFQDRLVSSYVNPNQSEYFGLAAAVSGSTAVIGAPDYGRSDESNGPGRAYGYSLPSGPPQAPALTGSVAGTTVRLSWTPAAGGAAAATYVVEAGSTPGSSNVYRGTVGNVLALSTTAPAATYYVRVTGVNAFGPGAPSNEITLVVGTPVAPLPGAPTLTGSVAQNAVSLAWTPASTGGSPSSYVVEAGTSPGASNLFNGNVGAGTRLSATVTPAVYHVRVRGVNASGPGPASNEIVLTATGCTLPATPAGLVFGLAGRIVTLSWSAASGAAAYLMEAGTTPGARNVFNGTVGGSTRLVTPAPPGTYYVRVRSANSCGTSNPTPDVTIVVP